MVAITLGVVRVSDTSAAKVADAAPAAPRKGLWTRFIDALIQSRMRQAEREIRLYTARSPYRFDEAGDRLVKTKAADMPFGGW